MDPSIFKAYDIRGLYQEQLDEQAAWKIGHATAQFLRSMVHGYDRGLANAQSICVGQDMRTHSPSLTKALIEGMNTAGANVIDIGMTDNFAHTFFNGFRCDPRNDGIAITIE